MKLKTIRMNPDRHLRLKAMAHAAGYKTMGKYLEALMDERHVRAINQDDAELAINAEVNRRMQEHLQNAALAKPEVASLIDREVQRRIEERVLLQPVGQTLHQWDNAIPDIPRHSSEDCARTMLNMLPESMRNFAYEVCEQILHIQPSQLIHGHLMNAADSGQLQAPHIDPSWEHRKAEEQHGAICEWHECQQPFTPDHWGQRYCGNICGGKAATAMLPQPAVKTQPITEAPGMQNLIAV